MPTKIPLMLLEMVLLPGTQAILRLEDKEAQKAIRKAYESGTPVGVLYCEDSDNADETAAKVGCLAKISETKDYEKEDGLIAKLEGTERFLPVEMKETKNGLFQSGYELLSGDVDMALDDAIFDSILHLLDIYLDYLDTIDPDMVEDMPDDLAGFDLTYLVLDHMSVSENTRQKALEIISMKDRAQFCISLLRQEIERLKFLIDGATEPEDDIFERPERLN